MKKICLFLIFIFAFQVQAHNEKVYALMITGKDEYHEFLARRSVYSFLQQSYKNKQLIIINDGPYTLSYNHPEIKEIKLEKKYVLGALRNIGLKQIPENALWVQWDDDDWHHPKIIEEQYNFLKAKRVDLCILKNQIQYAFRLNAAWLSSWAVAIVGTIMCRKKANISYPEKALSEDLQFFKSYCKKYKYAVWDNPSYYYLRFIHGHNSWNEGHFNLEKRAENQWLICNKAKEYLLNVLNIY